MFGDAFFAPCVDRDAETGACVIDFNEFHTVYLDVPTEEMHIQSQI